MNKTSMILSILIVYTIVILCRQVYNQFIYTKLPENIENMFVEESKYIPKTIYMTYKDKSVPQKVLDRWKKLNPDYNIVFHNNTDGYNYILKEYGQDFADFFNEIEFGPIKADFWRLCILYKEGGIYSDIDLVPYIPISEFIPKDITFCTLIAAYNDGKMTQSFIASTKGNLIIKKCIEKMYSKRNGYQKWWGIKYYKKYWALSGTYDMYDVLSEYLDTGFIKPGTYNINRQKILLFKEKCKSVLLGYDCHISNQKGRIMDMRSDIYDKDKHEFI